MEVVFLVSVMILEGIYKYENSIYSEIHDIFVPLLLSKLRFKRIKCQAVDLKGLTTKYKIYGRNNENIIYVPKFECVTEKNKVSFVYVDSTSLFSPSYRVSSLIRSYRSALFKDNVIFVEQLKEDDILNDFAPIIVDNIKVPENVDFATENLYISTLCNTVSDGICHYFGLDVD